MAPPTKTRTRAFAGRAWPRRRSTPSRVVAITPPRRQWLPPPFTRGRNTRALSQLRGRTAVARSRTPTPSRAQDIEPVSVRDTGHGDLKRIQRNLGRQSDRGGHARRCLGNVKSASRRAISSEALLEGWRAEVRET